jgi:hypothetical protein
MQAKQKKDTEMQALAKAATDETRQSEWEFHNVELIAGASRNIW